MKTSIMKAIAFTAILCSLLCGSSNAQFLDSTRIPGVEVYTIQSKILNEKRKIRIQLPAGGDNFTACPVLYVLDGEAQMNHIAGQI